jgi:hypothetical protein
VVIGALTVLVPFSTVAPHHWPLKCLVFLLVPDKNTIKDLLGDEIKDLSSAEKQLTKAIPKMAKGSHDGPLRKRLQAT